jgi:tetratricopeptide (TPR) repeat protein
MPQVAASANLRFTNHWIGIYDPAGRHLMPSTRAVQGLQPAPASTGTEAIVIPADPASLTPVYVAALSERDRESGPNSTRTARAASDLGFFLLQTGRSAEAETPLRRAVTIDEHNADPAVDRDREGLALALEAQGKRDEAVQMFKRTAEGNDLQVAARSFAKLAAIDPERAGIHYRNAVAAEQKASGAASPRLPVLLQEYALALRAGNRDTEAETLLRRALSIQQGSAKADPRVTVGVMNTLGNLLEGRQQLEEAEKLERTALALAEQKFGPESPELSMTCTNLADVLWNKKELRQAGLLYRRAITIDASLYGPDRPETAADIANLGMLLKEAGQSADGNALLRQALAIYENSLGAASAQARFVREHLGKPGH